ncbi:unnamed protein product [Caenorhabditis auriculariae]|uniref:C2H2-type domain-containing protein n=1 Tax=Caenorhabditis auriculariae TaxID=2777116 RepID=A0A8S1GPJ4_9PELO|nr:unnamed protein product [Caenorhabditis auriculariae]
MGKVKKEEDEEMPTTSDSHTPFTFSPSALSDQQCYEKMQNFQTNTEFLDTIPKVDRNKFAKAALRANPDATLSCFSCRKNFSSNIGFISHVSKCEDAGGTPDAADSPSPPKKPRVIERLKTPGSSRKGRPKKNGSSVEMSLESLQKQPSLWMQVSDSDRLRVLADLFDGEPRVVCFGFHDTEEVSFSSCEEALEHVNACCSRAMYDYYKDEKVDEFRMLDKELQTQYIREAMSMGGGKARCLVCGREFSHRYGLFYHVMRCNLDDQDRPWKCYRCGFLSTTQNSRAHLEQCWTGENRSCRELAGLSKDTLDMARTINGGDALLAVSGGTLDTTIVSAEEAVQRLLKGANLTPGPLNGLHRPRGRNGRQISVTDFAAESGRKGFNSKGQPRFKFRRSEIRATGGVSDISDYFKLVKSYGETKKEWDEEIVKSSLCNGIVKIKSRKFSLTEIEDGDPILPVFQRKSVTLRCIDEFNGNEENTVPQGKRIEVLRSESLEIPQKDQEDDAPSGGSSQTLAAFCGSPINCIRVAPNTLPNGDTVVCVCTFPHEEVLHEEVLSDLPDPSEEPNSSVAVQFWRLSPNGPKTHIWFVLHLRNRGAVLDARWLNRAQSEGKNEKTLVGFIALSTSHGEVLIYRIDSTSVSYESENAEEVFVEKEGAENVLVVEITEDLTLSQNTDLPDLYSDSKTNRAAEKVHGPPITAITWCASSGGQWLVGVNAMGALIVWGLNDPKAAPKVILDKEWMSPAVDVAFMSPEFVAVAFREKLIRIYDVRTWEAVGEESAVRTAGSRVMCEPRVLSGFATFQSDYAAGSTPATYLTAGINFVHSGDERGFVVVPLANEHELIMWNSSLCPENGTVATCGVDGKLIVSANGLVTPRGSKFDSLFNFSRTLIQLLRRRVGPVDAPYLAAPQSENFDDQQKSAKDEDAIECFVTHEKVVENMWIDVSFQPVPSEKRVRLPQSCRDQRIESLNAVDVAFAGNMCWSFVGGEAGLLFVVPSNVLDKATLVEQLQKNTAIEKN